MDETKIDWSPFIDNGGPILVSDLQRGDDPNMIKIYDFKVVSLTEPANVEEQIAKFDFATFDGLNDVDYEVLSACLDRLMAGTLVVLVLMNLKGVTYANLAGFDLEEEVTQLQWETKDIEQLRALFKSRTQLVN